MSRVKAVQQTDNNKRTSGLPDAAGSAVSAARPWEGGGSFYSPLGRALTTVLHLACTWPRSRRRPRGGKEAATDGGRRPAAATAPCR